MSPPTTSDGARYREVDAKTITKVGPAWTDPWFLARYGMNLYRGCEHGCVYCDGRAERYFVEGEFDRDITVKRNAPEVLDRELARRRESGFVMLGGGVSDAYQPAEAHHRLARSVLEVVLRHGLPVHVLTKSALVERDLDLLAQINARSHAILSFSIQTVDDNVRARFEPLAAPVEERWRILGEARRRGLTTGVMAMPVLPGISDQPEAIDRLHGRAAEVGVDAVCGGGLTLRPGVQKGCYDALIRGSFPSLVAGYDRLYRDVGPAGHGDGRYYARLETRFHDARERHRLPGRFPRRVFHGLVPIYTEISLLLEHEAYARRSSGQPPGGLDRASSAVQGWARATWSADARRRSLTQADVEERFRRMVNDGSLAHLPGVNADALRLARIWSPVE